MSTVFTIIGWVISIFFGLIAIVSLFDIGFLAGLFSAGIALLTNPKVLVPIKHRAWLSLVLFAFWSLTLPEPELENQVVTNNQDKVESVAVTEPIAKVKTIEPADQERVNKSEPIESSEKLKVEPVKPLALISDPEEIEQTKPEDTCKLRGKVIRIADGDTVTILDKNKESHKIRLAGIDAPERKQPYGKASKKYLSSMVGKKEVCVEWYKFDKYKRKIGNLFIDDLDVNYEMVLAGYAWHYKKFQKEQSEEDQIRYAEIETKAKLAVIGLWSEPDPIAPWDWRDGVRPKKKEEQKTIPKIKKANSGFSCDGKRFCKHMNSCAEARYYLNECGLGRLDRDKDGIPCEKLCGG